MHSTFVERHPYIFVISLELSVFVAYTIAGAVARTGGLGLVTIIVANGLLAMVIAGLLTYLGWWGRIGFRAPRQRSDLLYFLALLIPVVLNLIPARFAGNPANLLSVLTKAYGNPAHLLLLLSATLLVGFAEEGLYRGLMMQAVLPRGAWKAVTVTTLLFGFTHFANVLHGQNASVATIQVSYALAVGFVSAALVLRTGLIWPLMLTHFLTDFTGLPNPTGAGTVAGIPAIVGMIVVLVAVGLRLMLRGDPPIRAHDDSIG